MTQDREQKMKSRFDEVLKQLEVLEAKVAVIAVAIETLLDRTKPPTTTVKRGVTLPRVKFLEDKEEDTDAD